jgi:hypothetical protein
MNQSTKIVCWIAGSFVFIGSGCRNVDLPGYRSFSVAPNVDSSTKAQATNGAFASNRSSGAGSVAAASLEGRTGKPSPVESTSEPCRDGCCKEQ